MTINTNTRREFLWDGVKTFAWGALSLTAVEAVFSEARADGLKVPTRKVYGFLVDTTHCIGCTRCVDACCKENDVPEGQLRTWIERYVYFKDGSIRVDSHSKTAPYAFEELKPEEQKDVLKSFFVPKLCNHCKNTPCIQVCPTGASYQTEQGFVLIDESRCIGCSYCVQACPFGTRFINNNTGVADKCTWCYHRVQNGMKPACVEVCPSGSRVFGDVTDPESEISKALAANRIDVLKSYLGTQPRTRYIGLTAEVI
jgi:tetrathionate reductase subunit B